MIRTNGPKRAVFYWFSRPLPGFSAQKMEQIRTGKYDKEARSSAHYFY
jgi:hypothetical protein